MKIATKNNLVQVLIKKSQRLNEEEIIKKGIQVLARQSKSFKFLTKEPVLYSLKDVN